MNFPQLDEINGLVPIIILYTANFKCTYHSHSHENLNPKRIIVNAEIDAREFTVESYFRKILNHFRTIKYEIIPDSDASTKIYNTSKHWSALSYRTIELCSVKAREIVSRYCAAEYLAIRVGLGQLSGSQKQSCLYSM
ncbi:hypothetical protein ACOME3_004900 [Neoechinorhynchus agilis]